MNGRGRNGLGPTLLATILALSACALNPGSVGETSHRSEDAVTDPAPALTAIPTAANVAGQWDVVSFDGYRPQRLAGTDRAAYADFGTNGVSLRMECNYTGRPGHVANGRFVSEPAGDRIQTQIGCGPERGPRETRYFGFFELSPSVEFVGISRLRLHTGQGELVLERPSVRRLSYLVSHDDLQGEWEMLQVSWFPPAGGVAGIGLSDAPNRIIIERDRLRFRSCPEVDLTFRYTEDGELRKSGGATLPAGPIACPGLSDTADGPALPKATDAIRLLHADPLVEKAGEGALALSNEEYSLLIRRVA